MLPAYRTLNTHQYDQIMATTSILEHLTAFEDNDRLEELINRTPDDRLDFRIFYDQDVVNPWSENPNEITRLYFNADRLDDIYVPIRFPERLEEDARSTPIGRPKTDDDGDGVVDEINGGSYRIEEGIDIDGNEFDVLWYQESDDADEIPVIAAELGGRAR